MGLAIRVIPTLLKRGEHLVKGRQFSADRVVGHVQQAARIHQARGVDELIILDVDATPSGRGPDFEAVEELTRECFMPITIGGGVRSLADAQALWVAGADKVAVRTGGALVIEKIARSRGCQAVVASIDCMDTGKRSGYVISAQMMAHAGAGEILLTSIEREGTMEGYDIPLIKAVANAVDIPVIAHGGCSGPEDMLKAIEAGASAVAAGALFQFTDHTPRSCALWLKERGVEVRV
jgi:cyclase